jgi:hypothetical protein
MKRHSLVALAFAALAACETPISAPTPREPSVAGPSFAVVFNERLPFAFPNVVNPCNGEPVPITGEFHLLERETQDASGGSHSGFRISAHGEGVGVTTGVKYRWNDIFGAHENLNSSGAENFTFAGPLLIIARGNAPNFLLQAVFHFTINANGELTAFKAEFSEECKG